MSAQAFSSPPPTSGGFVSNEVIALQLRHLETTMNAMREQVVAELQLLRVESVRRDVYEEQRRTDQTKLENQRLELADLKLELKSAQQRKWAVWLALAGAGIALGRDLLVSLIQAGG